MPFEHRRTGKTTAIALETLAKAIRNPGDWICVNDHHDTVEADRNCMDIIFKMAVLMEWKVEFNKSSRAIRSNHYGVEVDRRKCLQRQLPDGEWK